MVRLFVRTLTPISVSGGGISNLNPQALGVSMRNNQVDMANADRILRRWRPELYAQNGPKIIAPHFGLSHGFVIDGEELEEIGRPAGHRPPQKRCYPAPEPAYQVALR